MQIERAEFEFIEPNVLPGLTVRVRIMGENLEQRAMPIMAYIGQQTVDRIVPIVEGGGVQGFLAETPQINDELLIGYADGPLINTGITYNPVVS